MLWIDGKNENTKQTRISVRNLRLIDYHRHSHLAVVPLCLGAIDPYWLRVVDRNDEFDRAWPSSQRFETGEESTGEGIAGCREATLDDAVVLGKVAEGEGVAHCGRDDLRVECELIIRADGDERVLGEGEGKEEGEEGER